jgi:Flp pilus assembly protein TadD
MMRTSQHPGEMAEIHRLMTEASAAYGRGDLAVAAQLCARVLAMRPAFPEALHLAGLCALGASDHARAIALLDEAAALKPGDAQLAHNLGIARVEAGDVAGARAAFAHAAALDPKNPSAQFNLGVIYERQGDEEQAEAAYRRCLLLAPHDAAAAASLAALCEQKSALEEATRWCQTALQLDPKEPVARLTQAQLHFRAGEFDAAAAILEGMQPEVLSLRNRALATGRLGVVYDRLDRPAEAWRMFLAAKETLRASAPGVDTGAYSFAVAERIHRSLEAMLAATPPAEGETPVFLVGFPRSGTTLLDQILSGHPGIAVLEEKDTLLELARHHLLDDASLRAFMDASLEALAEDRQRYWRRVEDYLPGRSRERVLVDKMPLNTLFLPVLARLFPAARFIFALRDPRDVVLSCFMQTFALNEAMRHFLALEETAAFYAAVMEIGRRSLEALPGRIHRVRYEDLVTDTEGETRRLLAFLELAWEPAVLDFHTTARRRRINTPSYHQVARPIYRDAQQRWKRYALQLEPVMGKLGPFVKAFGYD